MNNTSSEEPKSKRPRKFAREPRGALAEANVPAAKADKNESCAVQTEPKPSNKISGVLELLTRAEGATLEQMVAATGWLSHTTRAALTGLKKKGHAVTSDKVNGVRTYRVAAARAEPSPSPAGAQTTDDA